MPRIAAFLELKSAHAQSYRSVLEWCAGDRPQWHQKGEGALHHA
jgi:hypothetical protein